jgi:hypothetical protein
MQNNGVTIEQAAQLTPEEVREYALAKQWVRADSRRSEIAIFNRPGTLDQLAVPTLAELDDYAAMMFEIIQKLSKLENRSTLEVFSDLQSPDADNIRAGVMSPDAEHGQLDFDFAVSLYSGLRQAIVSAAHSVISPQRLHPRLNRPDALELLKAVRLNHSERSSFTVSVSLPLHPAPAQLTFATTEPFTRRVTRLLMHSLHRIHSAIENGRIESATAGEANQPLISANLCEALLKMQPIEDKAELRLGVSWAATRPAPEMNGLPRSIRFSRENFQKIATLDSLLRPADDPKPRSYIGYVERLVGVMGASGRREGDADIDLFIDGESIRARANLNADQHAVADRAYMAGAIVEVVGILERRRGLSRLDHVTKFELRPDAMASVSQGMP